MENGGTFYDPCSLSSCKNPTSRFPALQHHRRRCQRKQRSAWSRKKAKRERKKKRQKYLQVHFTYSSSFCFPSRLRVRPRIRLDIFGKSSHGFSVAIQTGNLPALSAGTLFCRGGPSKDASLQGPTTCGWITGHSSVIPYYGGKAARPLCLLPNWECQTFY